MKRLLTATALFVLGVIVGFLGPRPAAVRAQSKTAVHVTGFAYSDVSGGKVFSESVPGDVIGFSCAGDECYVLSR